MSAERPLRSILVAGVGNAWLRDDGFGGEVARRLEQRELPDGVAVMDAGTGGLDLAYEVMRGYDALVILDVSRAGRRARDAVRDGARRGRRSRAAIEDGEVINPHGDGPADRAAVRQVDRRVAGPGDRDRVRAGRRRGDGLGSLRARSRTRSSAPSSSCVETVDELRAARRPRSRRSEPRARAVAEQRDRQHGRQARRRAARRGRQPARRAAAPGGPRHARVLLRVRRPRTRSARARGSSRRSIEARLRCTPCAHEWEIEIPAFRCPQLRRQRRRDRQRQRVRGRVDRGRGGRMHRTKVKVVEEALDANNTIAARQPGGLRPRRRHGRQLHERSRRRQDDAARAGRARACPACASACSRATCRARWTPTASPACTCRSTQLNTDSELRRRVPPRREHGPLGDPGAAARRDRPADRRERRQPRLPGRVPDRRGRAGDGVLGDRGRGQAAEVPADVPRPASSCSSTRSTCCRTSTSTSTGCSTTSTRSTPTSSGSSSARGPARGSTRGASGCRRIAAREEVAA